MFICETFCSSINFKENPFTVTFSFDVSFRYLLYNNCAKNMYVVLNLQEERPLTVTDAQHGYNLIPFNILEIDRKRKKIFFYEFNLLMFIRGQNPHWCLDPQHLCQTKKYWCSFLTDFKSMFFPFLYGYYYLFHVLGLFLLVSYCVLISTIIFFFNTNAGRTLMVYSPSLLILTRYSFCRDTFNCIFSGY